MVEKPAVKDSSDWSSSCTVYVQCCGEECLFVGLDTARPLIHEHCKKLLVNLLVMYATHGDHFTVAKLAISSRTINEPSCLNVAPTTSTTRHTTGVSI